jgi:hypothetical protein
MVELFKSKLYKNKSNNQLNIVLSRKEVLSKISKNELDELLKPRKKDIKIKLWGVNK